MTLKRPCVVAIGLPLLLLAACYSKPPARNRLDENHFPRVILWAWERPEDLKTLDAQRFAVAFLAQTLVLKGDEVLSSPRRQPLDVSPEMKLMAVTRIESQKITGQREALTESQRQKVVTSVLKTSQLHNASAVQIDFDATTAEREFYRGILQELRAKLPDKVALSMTALASFCVGDRWLDDLPVDDAVPMIFRMGADERTIKNLLAGGEDFREPLCQRSYGIAVDEPVEVKFKPDRRVYVFNDHAWTAADIETLKKTLAQ